MTTRPSGPGSDSFSSHSNTSESYTSNTNPESDPINSPRESIDTGLETNQPKNSKTNNTKYTRRNDQRRTYQNNNSSHNRSKIEPNALNFNKTHPLQQIPPNMSKVVCRTIIPTAFAGNIFGKGGAALNEMRDIFSAKISIPNSEGPERNVYVETTDAKAAASCTVALALRIQNDMQKINRSLGKDDLELRMLLHTSQAGHIIGHKGDNITGLRKETNCKIKLHSSKCPMSTDRICQLSGSHANVSSCLEKILEDLRTTPLEGNVIQYDANNYNEREDYGGFRSWLIESATGKSFRYNSRNNNNFNDNSYNDRNYNNNSNYRRDNDFGTSRNFGRNDRNYDRNGRGRSYDDYRNNDYDNRNRQPYQNRYEREDPHEEDKVVCRLLIPTRLAGALIGKRGETVNRMRMDYDVEISIPTSTSYERTLRVMSAEHKNVVNCIKAMLEEIGPELRRVSRNLEDNQTEVRVLMHHSHAGYVIGQGGKNIKTLRSETGCRIIMNTEHCPYSTDRLCQISGELEEVVNCVDRVLVMIDETPKKGEIKRYNANFANDKIDYGGFKNLSNRRNGSGDGGRRYHSGDGDNYGNSSSNNNNYNSNNGGGSYGGRNDRYGNNDSYSRNDRNNNSNNGGGYGNDNFGGGYNDRGDNYRSRNNYNNRNNDRYDNRNNNNNFNGGWDNNPDHGSNWTNSNNNRRNDNFNNNNNRGYNNSYNSNNNNNNSNNNGNNGYNNGSSNSNHGGFGNLNGGFAGGFNSSSNADNANNSFTGGQMNNGRNNSSNNNNNGGYSSGRNNNNGNLSNGYSKNPSNDGGYKSRNNGNAGNLSGSGSKKGDE